MSPLAVFHHIMHNLEQRYTDLARGYMLSAPALEYKGRAFAFCRRDQMVIRLQDDHALQGKGIRGTQQYQPFDNRVALRDWREVPFYYHDDWQEIAEMALDAVRFEVDG